MVASEHRLLIVDDNVGICEFVADVAEGLGFCTRHRQTPDNLWSELEQYDPDVLILDLDLPHMDGVKLLGMLSDGNARQDVLLISGLDGENPESEAVVRSIVGLGHSLGLEVCAEGVETGEAMRHLASLGCDYFQGYHIAKPVPSDDVVEMFAGAMAAPDD